MDIYSIVIIVGFAVSLLLGFLLGFGRTLKFVTGGIVGFVCSIIFCVMFGGIIANIGFVAELIDKGNAYFGSIAEILAKLNVATWIYYVVLFLVVQIVRIIIVKLIGRIFTPKDKDSKLYGVRNAVNRVLGMLLLGAAFVLTVYLVMAVMALLTDVESVGTALKEMEESGNSFFYLMYSNNPIDLSVLFKSNG